ncbi:glycosyltransferase [Sphingomonas koreensis]|nr:glycosyltransferase [Sphingomonas koreensis]
MAGVTARHILTFAQSLDGGGVERAQLRLAAGWLAAGRRVTLMLGSKRGPLAAELPNGLRVIEHGSTAYMAMFDFPRHFSEIAPDLLFCPGNHYTSVAAWAWLELGTACPPVVAKLSNTLDRTDQSPPVAFGYRAWLRLHPRFVDHLVTMSPGMAREALDLMCFPRERISVIANPPAGPVVDLDPPSLPGDRFLLGIGRLEPQKRWQRLIEAMRTIADRRVKLVILGEGSERAALEALIARHGLADRVSLPGHIRDPGTAIRRAAVVVLVSEYEGVPGVLRESLAFGTPVVTTDSSVAVREIVTAPSLGTVVPRDDPTALVAALDQWLDPDQPQPAPIPEPGIGAAKAYLDLFDRLAVAQPNA